MSKAAAKRRVTTTPAKSDLEQYEAAMFAKQQFLTTALNMGWQLAGAVLIPLLFGVWLDNKFDSSPSYTITAFFIAIACGAMIVWKTVKGVNAEMSNTKRGKKN